MTTYLLLGCGLLVILIVIIVIQRRQRNTLDKKRQLSGQKLLRKKILDQLIRLEKPDTPMPRHKLMLELSWKASAWKRYVFDLDLEQPIHFGRSKFNQVIINWDRVSASHCEIFYKNNRVYARDLGSAHGTFLIRGRATYQIVQPVELIDKDILWIGMIKFHIHLFTVDTAFL